MPHRTPRDPLGVSDPTGVKRFLNAGLPENLIGERGWRSGNVRSANLQSWGPEVEAYLRLRYDLFGEKYRCVVTAYNGLETDRLDTPHAHYLVHLNRAGAAQAGVRLYPTELPYMLEREWPEMFTGALPTSSNIYEFTRIGVAGDLRGSERLRVKRELVCALLEYGLTMGVKAMIGVSLPGYWRSVFVEAGWEVEAVGPDKVIDGELCSAGLLRATPQALARVRAGGGFHLPST